MLAALITLWQRRRWAVLGVCAAVLAVAVFGAVRLTRAAGTTLPTAEAKRGEFVDYVQIRGEVKALKSVVLTAPTGAGDILILKLARSGTPVKKGDLIAQFDTSQLQRTLEQRRTDLKQADAEIERTRATWRMTQEQSLTELTKARYDVDRARLELSKAEILSKIEGEKNRLLLTNAEQKLKEVEQKLASDKIAEAADIESRKQRREKSLFEQRQAERNIAALTLNAPTDGMVSVMPNYRARMMFGPGSGPPDFREGDRAWPGAAIAELPDLSTIRITGRVDEADRGRVKQDQTASVRVDAVPDKELAGRVAIISALAKPDFSSWPVQKNFDLAVQLDKGDPRLRPGMSATARVAVDRLPNSILIPVEAIFVKNGRSVVYVLSGAKFEERLVEIGRRGPAQAVAAKGLRAGERVALQDPTLQAEGAKK